MKTLRIRSQLTVADPLQAERLLKALRIILEHQEAPNASSLLCTRLDPAATTRRVVCPNPADNSLSANTRYNALISPPSEGALPWCRIFFSTSGR